MNSKAVGEISEAVVLAELIKQGKTVLLPFGDNQRYDMVVEENNNFTRIQVKTGRIDNGCVVFNTVSISPFTNVHKGYKGEADLFAVYSPDLNKVYWIPVDDAPAGSMRLRVKNPFKASPNINWAEDYEILSIGVGPNGLTESVL